MGETEKELCLNCVFFEEDLGCLTGAEEFKASLVTECSSYEEEEK